MNHYLNLLFPLYFVETMQLDTKQLAFILAQADFNLG